MVSFITLDDKGAATADLTARPRGQTAMSAAWAPFHLVFCAGDLLSTSAMLRDRECACCDHFGRATFILPSCDGPFTWIVWALAVVSHAGDFNFFTLFFFNLSSMTRSRGSRRSVREALHPGASNCCTVETATARGVAATQYSVSPPLVAMTM